MRVCLIYDCLFPWTVGGAERWYRNLAERLAADGHDVTYLTLGQWEPGEEPEIPGVRVVAVGPRMALYTDDGTARRRILPPLRFGAGCLAHLVRHGRSYDVVHMASFPYFSLLAAAVARPLARYEIVVDWHEVWSKAYWTEYLGGAAGFVGNLVQTLCARVRQRAFCFSRLHARRLEEAGLRGTVQVLEGEYSGALERPVVAPVGDPPTVVFAGRLIPEKRGPVVPGAIAAARASLPALHGVLFGDGPDRERVLSAIADAGVGDAVRYGGFVAPEELDATVKGALCLLAPSSREGYGMVVVEASAAGVPSIVVAGPDNAAVELIEEGVNGFVAASAAPEDLARAILAVHAGGAALRESTADWFAANAERLSLEHSLQAVLAGYRRGG